MRNASYYSRINLWKNNSYDAFSNDIAIASIYFNSPHIIEYVKRPRMTWIDFVSNVGGVLGLLFGIGVIFIFEILWLLILLVQNQVLVYYNTEKGANI